MTLLALELGVACFQPEMSFLAFFRLSACNEMALASDGVSQFASVAPEAFAPTRVFV